MVVIRLVGLILLLALAGAAALFLVTRDRRYLSFAWRVLQFAFVFGVVFLTLYLLERVVLVL